MKRNPLLLTGFVVAVLGLAGANVHGAGTPAGTTVTNSVTLDYQVNGVPQASRSADATFVVDRALSVQVTRVDSDVVTTTPGRTWSGGTGVPALSFDVTNTGNDAVDLLVAVVDQGGTPVTGLSNGTGAFAGTNVRVAVDANANGVYDDGIDTLLAMNGDHFVVPGPLAEDATVRLLVVADVPGAAAADDQSTFTLVAAVADGTTLIETDSSGNASPGAVAAPHAAYDPGVVQNVFADPAGVNPEDVMFDFLAGTPVLTQGTASNGQHAASGAFLITVPALDVAKHVEVLWDPVTGNRYVTSGENTVSGQEPKAIPGALLMYVIGVSNDGGSAHAVTDVALEDVLSGALLPGNDTGEMASALHLPESISLSLNGAPVSLALPGSPDLDQIWVRACDGTTSQVTFNPSAPEVGASLGDCGIGDSGWLVFFATLD